jgi:hypothetical protein
MIFHRIDDPWDLDPLEPEATVAEFAGAFAQKLIRIRISPSRRRPKVVEELRPP